MPAIPLQHLKSIKDQYPFLKKTWREESYLPAKYYNSIIKKYSFNGEEDLQIFRNSIASMALDTDSRCLELGCGSGRVTKKFLDMFPQAMLDVLDLSPQMLAHTKNLFQDKITFAVQSDTLDYLRATTQSYDLVYSLWSFSHSIQQQIRRMSPEEVKNSLKLFLEKNLRTGGHFFIIHFDSMSEEQNIMMPLWEKIYPGTINLHEQSPSFKIITAAFEELQKQRLVTYHIEHKLGYPIIYESIAEALEVYMNFHLETQLNILSDSELEEIIAYLIDYFLKYRQADGKIVIRPGCFVMQAVRT